MARIRTIKPSFFKNEHLAELPLAARMLFIGLWCLCDREGRMEDRPKRIKADVFPYDSIDVDQTLSRLQSAGFINRYEVGEMKVIQVINFSKHQRISGTEAQSESELPEFQSDNLEALRKHSGRQERERIIGKDIGKGEGDFPETKNGKKKKENDGPPPKIVALPFDEQFAPEWKKWKDYKLSEFKFCYKSVESETAAISELVNLSKQNQETAIAIIQQSMAKGWKGFFELKNSNQNNGSNNNQNGTARSGTELPGAAIIKPNKTFTGVL